MNSLLIKETDNTPYVSFNINTSHFEIKGSSHPENPLKFFSPIMNWIDEYAKNPAKTTKIDFKLDYFNSSTAKYILNILWGFEKISKNNPAISIKIDWYYKEEDLDAFAAGERYAQLTTLKVNLVKE